MRLAPVLLLGCGRIGFDPLGTSGDGNPAGDVATDTSRANVVFLTSTLVDGAFGGLDAGDAVCADAARQAGLPGTFRAWLSAGGIAAPDRLAGSRGWIRTDGAPVIDDLAGFEIGVMFHPIDRDENGAKVPLTMQTRVWTGTDNNFNANADCVGWTSTVATGLTGDFTEAVVGFTENFAPSICTTSQHLYCFEVGHTFVVAPQVAAGRVAFVSKFVPNSNLAALDAACQADADAAGLGVTVRAAVATQNSSIAARFPLTTPWHRVDGTLLAGTAANLFDGSDLLAFPNQLADGTYIGPFSDFFRSGASDANALGSNSSTCADWTATTGQQMIVGRPSTIAQFRMWNAGQSSCSSDAPVLCLEP